jgi:c-di-GMP-binding flagellar brake protein YcgR
VAARDATDADAPEPLAAVDVAAGDRRFDVGVRVDIVSTMRALAQRRALATVYGERACDFIVSCLLAVHEDDDALVLDFGAERAATERVLAAGEVRVVTQLDRIRIQFATEVAGTIDYDGAPAFVARIPDVMQRLQRREYYRVRIPLSAPLAMTLAPDPARPRAGVALRVVDLSCGGVRLDGVGSALGIVEGAVYRGCRMDLPRLGSLAVDVRVVRMLRDDAKPGSCRVVGSFVDLPAGAEALLQRYINRIERDRNGVRVDSKEHSL